MKTENIVKLFKAEGIKTEKDYCVKSLTTYKIGGRAAVYAEVGNEKQLEAALKICSAEKSDFMVFGCFSNVLIREGAIRKVFIRLKGGFEKIDFRKTHVYAGAGVKNSVFLKRLAEKGLKSAEFMAGIPGSMGGAVYMKAGAYGKCMEDIIKRINVMDRKGKMKTIENKKGVFLYRGSVFQKKTWIITGVEIRLQRGDSALINEEIKGIIKSRHMKHPWKENSAGSVFKNKFPRYSAGRLIEEAGMKGVSLGGAEVSRKHANFIVNKENASFKDVTGLINKVKRQVYKKHGIKLKEEVRIIK
ncbi:MAG: UDP-N-acetylmuramate dehydrogenase [bacterium]